MLPKISIVIPVYNTELYLRECLDSAINQTYKNLEIIIVNDCSPDNSEDIVLEYQQKDSRVKYIKHEKNKGLLQARHTGIINSTGYYILPLDSDDYLSLNTCQVIASSKEYFDIIVFPHFSFSHNVNFCETRQSPAPLYNDKVFTYRFNTYGQQTKWATGGMCFSRELLLKILPYIPREKEINNAEDFLIEYMASYMAKSSISYDNILYYYRTDSGMSSGKFSIQKIQKLLSDYRILFSILHLFKIENKIQTPVNGELALIQNIFNYYFWKFSIEDQYLYIEELLNTLKEFFTFEDIYTCLLSYHKEYNQYLLNGENPLTLFLEYHKSINKTTNNKTIGLIDYNMNGGGGQRVSSSLIKEFTNRGYTIVLFTVDQQSDTDYDYSKSVERVIISLNALDNILLFRKYSAKYQIDLFIVQEQKYKDYLYNIYILKMLEKKVIYCHHTNFLYQIQHSPDTAKLLLSLSKIIDAQTVLYPRALLYWKIQGITKTYQINNPLSIEYPNINFSTMLKNNVVWVGCMDSQKNPMATLQAFEKAIPYLPDNYTLSIIGDGPEYSKCYDYILEHNLDKRIFLIGKQNALEFLQEASLHIVTSSDQGYDASPMVISEAKSFGVPTLMYEIPYIAFHQTTGLISVPQNHIDALSQKIIELLNNISLLKELGQKAYDSLEDFSTQKIMIQWEELFNDIYENNSIQQTQEFSQELYNELIQSMNISLINSVSTSKDICSKDYHLAIKIYTLSLKIFNNIFPEKSFRKKVVVKLLRNIFNLIKKIYCYLKHIFKWREKNKCQH